MASESETSCVSDPNFAVICSFIDKFGKQCGIPSLDFVELQEMLENTQDLAVELVNLHIKLLRRIKKSVSIDRWEKVLIRVCHTFSSQDAWELERFGYKKARTASKIRILKHLMEMQFDYHPKFKAEVNALAPSDLRCEPIGRDKQGHAYWYQLDDQCQIRVYREDTDEETWDLVAKDREGLVHLISQLSSGEVDIKDLDSNINEDSNSLGIEKPIIDTGQVPSTKNSSPTAEGDENSDEKLKTESSSDENVKTESSDEKTKTVNCDEKMKIDENIKIENLDEKLKSEKYDEQVKTENLVEKVKTEGSDEHVKTEKVEKNVKLQKTEISNDITFVDLKENVETIIETVDSSSKKESKKSTEKTSDDSETSTTKNPEVTVEEEKVPEFKKIKLTVKNFARFPSFDTDTKNVVPVVNKSIPPTITVKKKKSINDLAADLRIKTQDKTKNNHQEQEIDLSIKKADQDTSKIGSTEEKKIKNGDDGVIEEPVMYVKGEGSGSLCNNGNFAFIQPEVEFSEIVEEPMMYFYGEGSGHDCETGDDKKQEETTISHSERPDQKENICTKEVESGKLENNSTACISGSEEKVKDLISKWEKISDSSANQNSKTDSTSSESTVPKKTQFFFGPNSLKSVFFQNKVTDEEENRNNSQLDTIKEVPVDVSKDKLVDVKNDVSTVSKELNSEKCESTNLINDSNSTKIFEDDTNEKQNSDRILENDKENQVDKDNNELNCNEINNKDQSNSEKEEIKSIHEKKTNSTDIDEESKHFVTEEKLDVENLTDKSLGEAEKKITGDTKEQEKEECIDEKTINDTLEKDVNKKVEKESVLINTKEVNSKNIVSLKENNKDKIRDKKTIPQQLTSKERTSEDQEKYTCSKEKSDDILKEKTKESSLLDKKQDFISKEENNFENTVKKTELDKRNKSVSEENNTSNTNIESLEKKTNKVKEAEFEQSCNNTEKVPIETKEEQTKDDESEIVTESNSKSITSENSSNVESHKPENTERVLDKPREETKRTSPTSLTFEKEKSVVPNSESNDVISIINLDLEEKDKKICKNVESGNKSVNIQLVDNKQEIVTNEGKKSSLEKVKSLENDISDKNKSEKIIDQNCTGAETTVNSDLENKKCDLKDSKEKVDGCNSHEEVTKKDLEENSMKEASNKLCKKKIDEILPEQEKEFMSVESIGEKYSVKFVEKKIIEESTSKTEKLVDKNDTSKNKMLRSNSVKDKSGIEEHETKTSLLDKDNDIDSNDEDVKKGKKQDELNKQNKKSTKSKDNKTNIKNDNNEKVKEKEKLSEKDNVVLKLKNNETKENQNDEVKETHNNEAKEFQNNEDISETKDKDLTKLRKETGISSVPSPSTISQCLSNDSVNILEEEQDPLANENPKKDTNNTDCSTDKKATGRPILQVVDIKKLTQKFNEDLKDNNVNNDVQNVAETDPLATEEKPEEALKPFTLASFSLDTVDDEDDTPLPARRNLRRRQVNIVSIEPTSRKRTREPEKEGTKEDTSSKKRKTRGKRQIDVELRKSIEEQKRIENASSEDEEQKTESKSKSAPQKKKSSGGGGSSKSKKAKKGNNNIKEDKEKKEENISEEANESTVPSEVPPETPKSESKSETKTLKTKKKSSSTLYGLDTSAIIDTGDTGSGRNLRHSRRIAQLKIKEEAERRKVEDISLAERKSSKKKKSKKGDKEVKDDLRKKTLKTTDEESEGEPEVYQAMKAKHKKKKHQSIRKLFNSNHPWRSSSGSSTSNDEEEEEEEYVEEEVSEEDRGALKSDHEFSPESDLENTTEILPTRRARTVKKESDTEEPTDEHACQKCSKMDHPEWILLCDSCDCGWHCSCLRPALLVIPEGDWFCPPCQHNSLVNALKNQLIEYDKKASQLEIEVRRKERLAYVGISLDNVLPNKKHQKGEKVEEDEDSEESEDSESSSGSSSEDDSDEPIYQLRQRRQAHSYRFNDYDALINSAIQDEMEANQATSNIGRGKDIATIVNAEKEENNCENDDSEIPRVVPKNTDISTLKKADKSGSEHSGDEMPAVVNTKFKMRKKQRKLNNLDFSSEEERESDEDFKGESASEEDELDEEYGSEDSDDSNFRGKRSGTVRRSTRARTTRYDREFINDDSDEDSAPRKKKSRKIWSESESEDSDKSWGRRGKYKKKHFAPMKSYKKSKKKKKRLEDSDGEIKPKIKRPKIKYGGLDDSEDEIVTGRRTRGKKINFMDTLGSDSEEDEVKPKRTARILESEDEYVANEDDDDEEDEAVGENDEEKEDSDSESADGAEEPEEEPEEAGEDEAEEAGEEEAEEDLDEIPPVVPRKVIKLPVLAKIPKSPRARGRGRGKDGIPRQRKISVTEPITEKLPTNIPVIAANPEDLDEEEIGMMMEEEEYANKQLELMAIQLAKEKKKKELAAQAQKKVEIQEPKPIISQIGAIKIKSLSEIMEKPKEIPRVTETEIQKMVDKEAFVLSQPKSIISEVSNLSEISLTKLSDDKNLAEIGRPKIVPIPLSQLSARPPPSTVVTPRRHSPVPPIKISVPPVEMLARPAEVIPPSEITVAATHPIPIEVANASLEQPPPEPKKRGRRKKYVEGASPLKQQLQQVHNVPSITINKSLINTPMSVNNSQSEKTEIQHAVINDSPAVPTVVQDLPVTPPKRRGRGKGKKTLAAEQAAAAAAGTGDASIPSSSENSNVSGNGDSQMSMPTNSPEAFHKGKLAIAAPPQPFSQSQPTPSVITRMLQSQPIAAQSFSAGIMNQKYFAGINDQPRPQQNQFANMPPRGGPPSQFRPNMPNVNHYPGVRTTMPQMFHSAHHPMDPSPSGGGHMTNNARGAPSPSEPTNGTKMPGPAPARFPNPSEPPVGSHHLQFPSPGSHMQPSPPPRPPTAGGNFSPYHPAPPPNFHYGAYPPPPSLAAADDALPPTIYQNSPYPEHYNPADTSEGSNSKPFDEEASGEFGGLVSYFSSQREDDLDA